MLQMRYTFYFIFLHLIIATPQINLYYTHWVSVSDDALQHDCLRIVTTIEDADVNRQIISYCMSELSSKFNITDNDFDPKFTFEELSNRNITSQQLYIWSAPIDIVERYQFYLNQLSTLNDLSLANETFYNCTWPRFGPQCQYELYYYYSDYSSLYRIIEASSRFFGYDSTTNFICYTHLKCNRGPVICLDWTEICDGKVDCLDGEFDEEHCWQLEINKCKDNEYQCINGQCIPKSFYEDDSSVPDCLDGSDENARVHSMQTYCSRAESFFGCDDQTCKITPLTSSCMKKRTELILPAMFSIKDNSISDDCWSAFKCIIDNQLPNLFNCSKFCIRDDVCVEIIERTCPDMLYIPAVPVLFGHIYFAYQKNDARFLIHGGLHYPYICYNNSRYDNYFVNALKVLFNSTTCYYRSDILQILSDILHVRPEPLFSRWVYKYWLPFKRDLWEYSQIWKYNQTFNYISTMCNRSDMYQCASSLKCISNRYRMDNANDCPYGDDENITEIKNIRLAEQLIGINSEADEVIKEKFRYVRKHISFQTICDGFTELVPVIINGQNETDETECKQWQCDNIYTRCNYIWNCLNGADEIGCNLSLPLNCPSDHHICVSPYTNQLMCLPIGKANDGEIDCLAATDEPKLCRKAYQLNSDINFYCINSSVHRCISGRIICNGVNNCVDVDDDERFCYKNRTYSPFRDFCSSYGLFSFISDVEKFLCDQLKPRNKAQTVYFLLDGKSKTVEDRTKNIENTVFSSSSNIEMSDRYQRRCHRGLDLHVWLNNKNNLTNTCFCPPTSYGDQCQYQNQRVSLAIQFQASSDSYQTPFAIIISLIDDSDERIIHSYEQFTYLSMRDCKIKFNIYLLYSTRPKDSTKHYSIHIDIYEKVSLIYRGSLLYPVTFPFLPVYRFAFIVEIPRSYNILQSCSDYQCVHGRCIGYSNNPQTDSFCQCEEGWSGKNCTIKHTCMCSSDSLCIGVSANNRSICVCPMNKFGTHCLLNNTWCQTDHNLTCKNGGQCIPNDDYMVSNKNFKCICQKGFIGDRCEINSTKLIVSFAKTIVPSQSMFIHFIEVTGDNEPVRGTAFKTIPIKQDSVTVYWSRPFHLVFIELLNKIYYLAVVQKTYNESSSTITKMINPSDRCLNISELFNETFFQLHLLRRIKYYHLPCQNKSLNLSCFYDDIHLCLCYDHGEKHLTNCFEFKHNMTFDCFGQSICEKGVQCLQDEPYCPKKSMCVCSPCFYGLQCQFSTSGFGLSLDAILGYHILPHLSLIHQLPIVQLSLALTIIFIVAGLIDGFLSIITFKNKIVREVGCGLYLFGSSITTLLTIIIFGFKFFILVLAQMTIISNRSFLQVQCHSIDFVLRVCLNMDQWLNACVAIERAMTAIKGTGFVKKKSKEAAKFVIIILLIVNIGTCIHDPIYRRLIDEENDDEKRTWCIVTYPSNLEVYNYTIQIFHFFGPFMINLISSIILITTKSRQQANVHRHRPYKQILREQFREHRNLLTAPILLVILALPRLIIVFVSKCMKSTNEAWLFLIGYFISFIPSMLTFIIFILPSKFYKKKFKKSLAYYRSYIQRRLHLI